MYNSFILRLFAGAYDSFALAYRKSILKSMVDNIKRCFLYLTHGSMFISIFTEDSKVIESGIFYNVFSKIIGFGNQILESLNKIFKRNSRESITFNIISKLFSSNTSLIRSISVFTLFFGVGIIFNNVKNGAFSGRSYIISLAIIIVNIISLSVGEDIENLCNNSFVYRFIKDLFIIDEGGDQWW